MGLINFLKQLIEKKEEPKKEEKVVFDEINNWIDKKNKDIGEKERKILVLINNKILEVSDELKNKVRVLENVDLKSKKVEKRIELIVEENLNHYIGYLNDFIKDMGNLEEKELDKMKHKINNIFSNFDKRSFKSYQKVTFLVGKEIADMKESIVGFSKYLTNIFEENKKIIDSSKVISSIKLKLKQIDEINESSTKVNEEIISLDLQIKNSQEMNKNVLEEIQKIKNSESYGENLRKQEEIKISEKELEKDISKLKEIIDFKALGNVFHSDEKKMNIVKFHRKDFRLSLQKDNGVAILGLLDEAKLNNEIILNKIKQINEKRERITRNKSTIIKDETKDSLAETARIKLNIENLTHEKNKEIKKSERFKVNREVLIKSIKEELSKLNVKLTNH